MIYVDSCILIHAVEDRGPSGQIARDLLRAPGRRFAISPLVVAETLVVPLRANDDRLRARYESFFGELENLEIGMDAFVRSALLRARTPGLETIDALHLATAQLGGCSAFWTNDKRLAVAAGAFAIDIIGSRT